MKQEDTEVDTAQTDAIEREEHADYIEAEVRQSESNALRASTLFKDKGTTRESEESRAMASATGAGPRCGVRIYEVGVELFLYPVSYTLSLILVHFVR